VQRKALLWINAMSSSAPSTNRGIRARLSGGLAFWHWSRAAYQWNLGSSDDEYSSEATEAIRYAWAALKASASHAPGSPPQCTPTDARNGGWRWRTP
jgi:hypothetical protein